MRLEDAIAAAAEKAAAAQQKWEQKHHPIRIGEKTYWLSTDIPKNIQDTLDLLPKNREKSDIKRANQINELKAQKAKERLFRRVWQRCAKAASLALRSQNGEDAALCIEQMQALAEQMEGQWQAGWHHRTGSYSIVDGTVESKVTWKQISQADLDNAERILRSVQEEANARKAAAGKTRTEPMPIGVKLTRGEISFRHPDSQRWVRGKRLGEAFTLHAPHTRTPSYGRSFQEILQK